MASTQTRTYMYNKIVETIEALGYTMQNPDDPVYNTCEHGIAHCRRRVYFLFIRNDAQSSKHVFRKPYKLPRARLNDVLDAIKNDDRRKALPLLAVVNLQGLNANMSRERTRRSKPNA